MKDLGIYNEGPSCKKAKDTYTVREDYYRPVSSRRWRSRRLWLFISLLWCCAAFFLGYIYGRRWLVDDAQHVIRLSVKETTAEDLATVIMLGMEKGIIVRDGCVYQGESHLDDCPCTVKGSSCGVNRHSQLIGAYRYFDQHPDKDWIVNNAIYRYNKTGQWRN